MNSIVCLQIVRASEVSLNMYSAASSFKSYCVLIIWILALAGSGSACSGGDEDKYRIVRKTDEGDKQLVVATEETAKMYCRTNVPWKKCWWKPPRNGVRQVSTSK